MGRCQEFGPQIRDGCGHAMRPGENACFCPECGVTCGGLYAGCPDVWKRGPRTVNTAVMTVDAPRVHLGLSAGGNGQAQPIPGTARAIRELDAGSAPERNWGAAALGDARPEPPERPDRADVVGPSMADRTGEEVPEDPNTWGRGQPVRSDSVGTGGAERRHGGGTRSAEQQVDSLLEEDEGPIEIDLLPTPDRAARAGSTGPVRERSGTVQNPEVPNPASAAYARGRVPLTSDWDPDSFTDDSPLGESIRGARRRGLGGVEGVAVPAEMDDSDPRTHVLKWMEKRFDSIRAEVQMLASSANRQQETLELLVDRQSELEARFEQEAERADDSGTSPATGRGRHPEGEPALDDRAADILRIASDELGRLVDEVVTALQDVRAATAASEAAQHENTDRLRLLQAAVTKQLRTMTVSIGEWEERSEARAAAYTRRVEALAKRLHAGAPEPAPPRRGGRAGKTAPGGVGAPPEARRAGRRGARPGEGIVPARGRETDTAPGGAGAPPRLGGRAGGVPARGRDTAPRH